MAATVYAGTYFGSPGTSTEDAGIGIAITTDMNAKLLRLTEAYGGAGYSYSSGTFTGTGDGGAGGIGVYLEDGGNINTFGTISGGAGGNGALSATVPTDGGVGGIGLRLELESHVLNHGVIDGGAGGLGGEGSASLDGKGGIGVALNSGGFIINSGAITGGAGAGNGAGLLLPVVGPIGGTGGDGVFLGEKGTLKNHGTVTGGSGGYGGYKDGGGVGGIGVEMTQVGSVRNTGDIFGGAGAAANFKGEGGTGGDGIVLDQGGADGRVVNTVHGDITGGAGGPGAAYNSYFLLNTGGAGGVGVYAPAGGFLINRGNISGGAGGAPPLSGLVVPPNASAMGGDGVNLGGGGVIHNFGSITGGEGGANGGDGGIGAVLSGGPMSDVNHGVISGGESLVLLDLLQGDGGVGVEMTGQGVFDNTGLITGGVGASAGMIFETAGSKLVNFGTVSGGGQLLGNVAVDFAGDGSNEVVIDSKSSFNGIVEASGSNNVVELSGTALGTLNDPENEFTGFQTFKVDKGSSWSLSGDIGSLGNSGVVEVKNAALDITGQVNPYATGLFQLTGRSSLEIASLMGSTSQIAFAGTSGSLIIDDASKFGVTTGGVYGGPLLEDFKGADSIDLKGIGYLGLQTNYNSTTGILQISSSSTGVVASLDFQNSSLGAGSFHLASDLSGGCILTHSTGL